jgi:hypothetical protein
MKKSLIPTLAILLLCFGCKKTDDNQPPADMPQYESWYIDSLHQWRMWYPLNSASKVQLDRNVVHQGRYSAAIIARGDSGKYGTGMNRYFTTDYFHGNRVRFSYWAKTKEISGKVWANAIAAKGSQDIPTDPSNSPFDKLHEFIDKNTGIDLESKKSKLNKFAFDYDGFFTPVMIDSTSDWKQYHLELDIPTNTDYVRIGFAIEGKGSLWIDDITYEKIKKLPVDSGYVDRSDYFTPLTGLDFEY